MNLGYIYYYEPGYSWTGCVAREDILEVPGYYCIHIIQSKIHNRAEKSNFYLPYDAWKFMTKEKQKNGWIFLNRPGSAVPDLSYQYFSRSVSKVISMAAYFIRMVTTQVSRDRINILIKRSNRRTPFNMTRRKTRIHLKSQTWHPLNMIITFITRNSGCPKLEISNAAQPVPLASVVQTFPVIFRDHEDQMEREDYDIWVCWHNFCSY